MSANLFITSSDFIKSVAGIYWDESKASRLKALRGDESMQVLADRIGVSRLLIRRLEKNLISPTNKSGKPTIVGRETLEAICNGLSISLVDFLQVHEVVSPKDFLKIP